VREFWIKVRLDKVPPDDAVSWHYRVTK